MSKSYSAPTIEVLEIELDGAVLQASLDTVNNILDVATGGFSILFQ